MGREGWGQMVNERMLTLGLKQMAVGYHEFGKVPGGLRLGLARVGPSSWSRYAGRRLAGDVGVDKTRPELFNGRLKGSQRSWEGGSDERVVYRGYKLSVQPGEGLSVDGGREEGKTKWDWIVGSGTDDSNGFLSRIRWKVDVWNSRFMKTQRSRRVRYHYDRDTLDLQ